MHLPDVLDYLEAHSGKMRDEGRYTTSMTMDRAADEIVRLRELINHMAVQTDPTRSRDLAIQEVERCSTTGKKSQ